MDKRTYFNKGYGKMLGVGGAAGGGSGSREWIQPWATVQEFGGQQWGKGQQEFGGQQWVQEFGGQQWATAGKWATGDGNQGSAEGQFPPWYRQPGAPVTVPPPSGKVRMAGQGLVIPPPRKRKNDSEVVEGRAIRYMTLEEEEDKEPIPSEEEIEEETIPPKKKIKGTVGAALDATQEDLAFLANYENTMSDWSSAKE